MNLYFAACHVNWYEIWNFEVPERILLSYHYEGELEKTLKYCKERNLCNRINLMLDSGAFSAWNKGITINKEKYLKYAEKIRDNYDFKTFYAVNLDVIPGQQGCKITKEMSEKSMHEGWENYHWFKKRGLDTIHVYHEGEDEKFLLETIIKDCKYIGVSPSNDSSITQKMMWLERIFHILPEEIKTHGFAVTSTKLIRRFPWTSVDSASWCISAGMGRVYSSFGTLYYSNKGVGQEFLSDNKVLQAIHKEQFLKEVLSYGVKFKDINTWHTELQNDHRLRRLINYCYFKKIGQQEIDRDKIKKFINPQASFNF